MFLRPIIIGFFPQDSSIKNNLHDIFIFLIAPLCILGYVHSEVGILKKVI